MRDRMVPFDTLSLGQYFVLGGRVYLKTDDSCCKRVVDGVTERGGWAVCDRVLPITIDVHESLYAPTSEHMWTAVLDSYDGAPDAPVQVAGMGRNAHDAIRTLAMEIEDTIEDFVRQDMEDQ